MFLESLLGTEIQLKSIAAYLLFNDKPIRGSAGVQRVLTCLCAKWTSCCELIQLGSVLVNYTLWKRGWDPTS